MLNRHARGTVPMATLGVVTALLAAAWMAGPVRAAEWTSPTLSAIESAHDRGVLTDGQAMLYKLYFIRGSDKLPAQYNLGDQGLEKCGTEIVAEAQRRMSEFDTGTQHEILNFLQRPTLNSFEDTAHYRVHFSTSGRNIIYLWPDRTYLDAIKVSVETSWTFYHVTKDWQVPPSDGANGGGSGLIDIYVDALSGVYGYTEAESPVPGGYPNDYTAFLVIDNDYTGFGYSDRTVPMQVTVAHEDHHVVQMGYSINIGWWMENTSTFMEDEVYDSINDNYQYLGCFLVTGPWKKMSTFNGCFEYGHFLWPTYIKDAFDHQRVREIWECCATTNVFTCFDTQLAPFGSNLANALAEYDVYNYYAGVLRSDGSHYAESGAYGSHYLSQDKTISAYPALAQHPTASKQPEATGCSVQKLVPQSGSPDNKLTITFDGASCTKQVVVIRKEPGVPVSHEYYMTLDANGNGSLDIPNWTTADTEYAFMLVSMPRTCGNGTFDFVFDATTSTSTAVNENPSLYQRTVDLRQNSPNPFSLETRIAYSLTAQSAVGLSIYDAAGREIRNLVSTVQPAGEYSIHWDGRDDSDRAVTPGVYFYRLNAGGATAMKKMLVLE